MPGHYSVVQNRVKDVMQKAFINEDTATQRAQNRFRQRLTMGVFGVIAVVFFIYYGIPGLQSIY